MKTSIRTLLLSFLFLFTGWAYGMPFPSVENLQFQNNILVWDEVPNAGGYNIYYMAGGPSKNDTREYLATVRNSTSFSDAQPGIYSVIAFSQDETQYSEWSSAETIWLKTDGTIDTGNQDGTDITFYGPNKSRYLVVVSCSDRTGICIYGAISF